MSNEATNKVIADQQVENIAKLLNGRIIRRVSKDSSGAIWRSITVEYADTSGTDGERDGVRRDVRGQEDEIRPTEVDVNSRFEQGLCDWP